MKPRLKSWGLALLMLSLAGCGFGLRQPKSFTPALQTIYIHTVSPANPYDPFVQNLRRVLVANNVTLVDNPKDASSILNILNDQVSNTMVAAGGINVAGFYTAYLTVVFSVTDPQGRILLSPTSIQQSQNFTSNATQVLSGDFMALQLANQMNQSLAQELVNQLAKVPALTISGS